MQLSQGDLEDVSSTTQTDLLRLWATIVLPFIQDAEAGVHEAAIAEVSCPPSACAALSTATKHTTQDVLELHLSSWSLRCRIS